MTAAFAIVTTALIGTGHSTPDTRRVRRNRNTEIATTTATWHGDIQPPPTIATIHRPPDFVRRAIMRIEPNTVGFPHGGWLIRPRHTYLVNRDRYMLTELDDGNMLVEPQ